jgi:WD40 repeat protein
MAAAFSADGKWLASGDGNGRIFLWDTGDWQLAQTFGQVQDLSREGYTIPAGVAVSPGAQYLAAGTVTGQVLLYQHSVPEEPRVLYEGQPIPRQVAFSPDGLLAFTTDEGLKVWSAHDQAYLTLPESEQRGMRVDGLRFSPDGRYLAAGVHVDNGVYTAVWDLTTRAEPLHFEPSRVPPAFSSDGTTIGTGISPQAGIRLFASMFPELAPYPGEFPGTGKGDLTGLALSLDGRLAIAAIEHGGWEQMRIEFWTTHEWELAHTLRLNGSESSMFSNVVEMSPDGMHLVLGAGAGHALQVWGIRWNGEQE